MNEWARRRKRLIFLLLILGVLTLVGLPLYFLIYQAPNCTDGNQNGDETGVDCGGSCDKLCSVDSLPLLPKGDPRILKVRDNEYEVVAMVENPNANGEVYRAKYVFTLYDASGIAPIKKIEGSTFIPKGTAFAVFEGPFKIEQGVVPTRAILEWQDGLNWYRNTTESPKLAVKDLELTQPDFRPRLDAIVENLSLETVSNIDFITVIYDDGGNVSASSKTFIDKLDPGERAPIVYTWPTPFKFKESICAKPVDVALVIDRSGTMQSEGKTPQQPLTAAKDAAKEFVKTFSGKDQITYVSFATDATVDNRLSGNLPEVNLSIDKTFVKTGDIQKTNFGDALKLAVEELTSPLHHQGAEQVVVLLTDGDVEDSIDPYSPDPKKFPSQYAFDMVAYVKSLNITIYTIGLGKASQVGYIKDFATTPDLYYPAPTRSDLEGVYKEIATKICKKGPVAADIFIRIFPDNSFLR